MTIQLPKELRGFTYRRVMPADFNTFDIDLLLPAIYFKVVSGGQDRARRSNESQAIGRYTAQLAQHGDFHVSSNRDETRLIDRLVRTAVVRVGKAGEGRAKGEQIQSTDDATLLSFKPGFPSESTSLRHVDGFVYQMLKSQFTVEELQRLFVDALGQGSVISGSPEITGTYDRVTTVDTMTRLSMAYLDGFESTGIRYSKNASYQQILPGVAEAVGRDLERFLRAYAPVMPARALTYHLKALIAFSLLIYTVKLMHALPALCEHPESLPVAMRDQQSEPTPPWLYVDFTEHVGHRSREMAVAGAQRDLGQIAPFISSVLLLRQLDAYLVEVDGSSVERLIQQAYGAGITGPNEIAAMLRLHRDSEYRSDIEAAARRTRRDIIGFSGDAKRSVGENADLINDPDEIEAVSGDGTSALEQVVRCLVDGQQSRLTTQVATWYSSVGGIRKPYGILQGVVGGRGRLGWRYQPSNDLLATLVMMAGVDIPAWDPADPRPQPIRLRDFLDWLERRFSILVDRPPDTFSGAEYQAAAQDNLRAMLGRLRQMGVFRDLSDDFTVQRLIPPYTDAVPTRDQRPQEQTR